MCLRFSIGRIDYQLALIVQSPVNIILLMNTAQLKWAYFGKYSDLFNKLKNKLR